MVGSNELKSYQMTTMDNGWFQWAQILPNDNYGQWLVQMSSNLTKWQLWTMVGSNELKSYQMTTMDNGWLKWAQILLNDNYGQW